MKKLDYNHHRFSLKLIEPFILSRYKSSIFGDIEEQFYDILSRDGKVRAYFYLVTQILTSLPVFISVSLYRSVLMFKSYFKVAMRNMVRQKVYSLINIVGLSIGIACSVLIFMYVQSEFSYDNFHEKSEKIYRVWQKEHNPERGTLQAAETPFPLYDVLKSEYPEIEKTLQYFPAQRLILHRGEFFTETNIVFAYPEFLEIFSFPIIKGDRSAPLADLNSVVLTEQMAEKYFPGSDPIGQNLSMQLNDVNHEMTVTAVAKNVPRNSSITFDFLISMEKRKALTNIGLRSWGSILPETFVLLKDGVDPAALQEKLKAISTNHYEKQMRNWTSEYLLQPLSDIYLGTDVPAGITTVSDPMYSFILSGIGILVLFIASINFMTLSIGRSTSRAKEVGMRKVMGAFKGQLAKQYLGEAIMLSFIALLFGIVIAGMLLPTFNSLANKELSFSLDMPLIAVLVSLMLIVGVAAGSYPAVVLSRFQPVGVLKSTLKVRGKSILSKALVVTQFALSIFLIVCTLLMQDQLNFIREKNLGYDKERIVVIAANATSVEAAGVIERYKNEIQTNNNILSVSASANQMGIPWTRVGFRDPERQFKRFSFNVVDYDYINTMGIELIAGRDFSREFATDENEAIIVNESLLKYFGWEDHRDKKLPGTRFPNHTIIGVVKDFHFNSVHTEIRPLALTVTNRLPVYAGINDVVNGNSTRFLQYMQVRIASGDILPVINFLKESWQKVSPNVPFELTFLDETIDGQYTNDEMWGTIINYASLFAIAIACLGLFGLSALSVEKRIKEIGIRKVLGSSITGVISLVSRDLLLLVILANVFAWPAAFQVMSTWLQNFAFRVSISPGWFLLATGLAMLIAAVTISFQTIKAAMMNPVKTLRYE